MAVSPKFSRRQLLFFRNQQMSVSIVVVILAGLFCCILIVAHLHDVAQRINEPATPGGAGASRWSMRSSADPEVAQSPEEGAVPRAEAAALPQVFALVPRPLRLEPLALPPGDRNGPLPEDVHPTLWYDASFALHSSDETQAVLSAYEEILRDVVREPTQPQKLATLAPPPPGGIVVAFRDDPASAYDACAVLVGHDLAADPELVGPLLHNSSEHPLDEWHLALSWNGRLAICSTRPVGAFRFAATLRQMLDAGLRQASPGAEAADAPGAPGASLRSLPTFLLEDVPRYSWRGLQLDCVRHFMPVAFIKRYLRAMAYYKANAFHWHLTDDQAWRLYVPSRPKLVGSNKWSPDFYTPEDVREVVAFAAGLFITVMPTIETPGHSLAALAAYPELACEGEHFEVPKTRVGTYDDIMCVGKLELEQFARDVIADVASLFPGRYVHVGGDETPTMKWERSARVKAFAGMAGLRNLNADIMEAWYCFISSVLAEHNRTPVMWDDHFGARDFRVSRLCPGAEKDWVVQAWKMSPPVGTHNQESISSYFHFRTIASPMKSVYLDYPVASIDYNKTLQWDLGAGNVLGGCANMWTEDSEPKDVGAKVYPRYLGIAERLWGASGTMALRAEEPRVLDESCHEAARRHCSASGALTRDFGFSCGKFAFGVSGRSKMWSGAAVRTSMDTYEKAFSAERALDGDEDSYFWAIAPKKGDVFEVSWRKGARIGKWFRQVVATTGSKDRPGDQLDSGVLQVLQWRMVTARGARLYRLKWANVANFVDGVAKAEGRKLMRGPTVSVRIVCGESQTKWMALPEITAVEGTAPPRPTQEDIEASLRAMTEAPAQHAEQHGSEHERRQGADDHGWGHGHAEQHGSEHERGQGTDDHGRGHGRAEQHGSEHGGRRGTDEHGWGHGHAEQHGSEHEGRQGTDEHGWGHGTGRDHAGQHAEQHGGEHGKKHGGEHGKKQGSEHGKQHGKKHGSDRDHAGSARRPAID